MPKISMEYVTKMEVDENLYRPILKFQVETRALLDEKDPLSQIISQILQEQSRER